MDPPFLRHGTAGPEVGVVHTDLPEVHVEHLHEDRVLGAVRAGHPPLDAS
ncbi:hypothetical protein ACWDGI_01960 [Streptomyces sp. NPDC001220]